MADFLIACMVLAVIGGAIKVWDIFEEYMASIDINHKK